MDRNIKSLKDRINTNAAEARALRDEARETYGIERYNLQQQARDIAPETRCLLMAYGLLRGKTPEQIESPNTVTPFYHWRTVLSLCEDYYWAEPRKDQTQEEYEAEKAQRLLMIKAHLIAWQKTTTLNNLTRKAEQKLAS